MLNEQRFFREFLRLVGKNVAVGLLSTGRRLQGRVVNAMFDSALLECPSGREIIRFDDLSFLEEVPAQKAA